MPRYDLVFKKDALKYLNQLNKVGKVMVKGTLVSNVRELVSQLGISTYTLYKWNSQLTLSEKNDSEASEKSQNSQDELNHFDLFEDPETPHLNKLKRDLDEILGNSLNEERKDIMDSMINDNTFWMSVAKALKVQYYRCPLKELYIKIGNRLLQMGVEK